MIIKWISILWPCPSSLQITPLTPKLPWPAVYNAAVGAIWWRLWKLLTAKLNIILTDGLYTLTFAQQVFKTITIWSWPEYFLLQMF